MATDLDLERPADAPDDGGKRRNRRRRGRARLIVLLCLATVAGLMIGGAWASGALGYGFWWLTNTEPPTITLSGPQSAVRGSAQVATQVSPRAHIVRAEIDGRPLAVVPESGPLIVDTAGLSDGPHRVVAEAEDLSWRKNRAQTQVEVRSDNTPPQLTLDGQPAPVREGKTWLLHVLTNEPATVEATLDGRPLELLPGDGFGWAIVGIPADDAERDVPLVVSGSDTVGNRTEQRSAMKVAKTDYTRDSVDVGPNLMPLLEPKVRADEDARLAPTYSKVSQPRLWTGPFQMPAQGPIVTQFGEVRSYNGGPFGGHHTGVDIAVPGGRPVLAPARAKVALIDQVPLRGNIVVLDHGLGVFTTYGHLSSVDVEVGQEIQTGQPFAKVGSTGLSEGPHLHWELWVHGVNVDPLEWTDRSIP